MVPFDGVRGVGVSLNIKNERVHALAREAARLTGKTQTSAIEEALERLIADRRRDEGAAAREARIDQVFAEIDALPITAAHREETRRQMDDMYDEQGLPR